MISSKELKEVLCGQRGSDESLVNQIMEQADLNKDGQISREEFSQAVSYSLKKSATAR